MPTIVGILKFVTWAKDIVNWTEQENCFSGLYCNIDEDYKLHAPLSWACKKFYNIKTLSFSLFFHYIDLY